MTVFAVCHRQRHCCIVVAVATIQQASTPLKSSIADATTKAADSRGPCDDDVDGDADIHYKQHDTTHHVTTTLHATTYESL